MIHAVLIFNNAGKPRLTKFYSPSSAGLRARLVQQLYVLVSSRPDSLCNFVEIPEHEALDWVAGEGKGKGRENGEDGGAAASAGLARLPGAGRLRVVYRHYATLYFAFVVDEAESELGILDLIQVFVESLDRCFANVCELDLVFNYDQVHLLLAQMVVGGLVLDTSVDSVAAAFRSQLKARKASAKGGSALGSLEGLQSLPGVGSAASVGWRAFGR